MKNTLRSLLILAAAGTSAGLSHLALATNGYFAHGWGTRSKAMAGVSVALPQDTLAASTNPAGIAFIAHSLDLGLALFNPSPRGYRANPDYATQQIQTAQGVFTLPAGGFVTPGEYDSSDDWFLIPALGYSRPLDERSSIGLVIFGNGGMTTRYRDRPPFENFAVYPNQRIGAYPAGGSGPYFDFSSGQPRPVTDPIPGTINGNPDGIYTATTPTGVRLEQLFIEVPYGLRIGDGRQAVGIGPVFAIQRFKASGLEPFKQMSVRPDKVTNNGYDWSYGVGLHLGWYGQITERLALGASYRTRIWMSKFDEYAGLFADNGSFDIPAMLNLGLAYRIQPRLTIAFDYQHLFYNEIDAIANSNDIDLTACQTSGPKQAYCLGGDSGVGFGWASMDVFKLGLSYAATNRLTLMGGVSYNTDFLKTDRQGLFNVLAPATIRWHWTLGAAYRLSNTDELVIALAYMPKATFHGTSPMLTQTQTGSLYMEQFEVSLGWTHRF